MSILHGVDQTQRFVSDGDDRVLHGDAHPSHTIFAGLLHCGFLESPGLYPGWANA